LPLNKPFEHGKIILILIKLNATLLRRIANMIDCINKGEKNEFHDQVFVHSFALPCAGQFDELTKGSY
jgi:hypothetical protein